MAVATAMDEEKRSDVSLHEAHIENHSSSDVEDTTCPEKVVIRRVDWRLLPILGALYAIALIDRVNVCANCIFSRRLRLH